VTWPLANFSLRLDVTETTPGSTRSPSARHLQSAIASVLLLATLGCSGGAEYLTLQQFFEASRLRDRTALGAISTVAFEPLADGTLTTFRVVSLGPEQKKPVDVNSRELRIAQLSLDNPNRPEWLKDLEREGAELISKDVRISAQVRLPGGGTGQRTVNLVLQRAVVKGGRTATGRWIVTGFVMHG
jgi:hypothetical protein